MRSNRKFVIGIVAFLVLVLIAELNMPQKFSWNPTFRSDDRQPLGAYVVDSLMKVSMPHGYQLVDKTLYQLSQDTTGIQPNIVVVGEEPSFTKTDMRALRRMLNQGRKVLLMITSSGDTPFNKEFSIESYAYTRINPVSFKHSVRSGEQRRQLRWCGASHPPCDFWVYSEFDEGHVDAYVPPSRIDSLAQADSLENADDILKEQSQLVSDSLHFDSLIISEETYHGWNDDGEEYSASRKTLQAVRVRVGKGELFVCPMLFLFTNFTVLDDPSRDLLFRLMSQVADRPVVKTENYLRTEDKNEDSPLSFFLARPPLRWAVYLSLLGVLLYFIFTARRRQRVIPVVHEPENKSLEFVRLIGTLYHQQHDNTDLVRKKYQYFAEYIRRKTMVDIGIDLENLGASHRAYPTDDGADLLAEYLGMPYEAVAAHLAELRQAIAVEGNLPDRQMRHCIDIMDSIVAQLKEHL